MQRRDGAIGLLIVFVVLGAAACGGGDVHRESGPRTTTSHVPGSSATVPSGEPVTVANDGGTLTADVLPEWEVTTGRDGFTVAPSIDAFAAGFAAPGVAVSLLVGQDDPGAALDDWLSGIGNTNCEVAERRPFQSRSYAGSLAVLACDDVEFMVITAARGTGDSFIAQVQATTDNELAQTMDVVGTIAEP